MDWEENMSISIKALEELGSTQSLKQFNNIGEMLTATGITQKAIDDVIAYNKEHICVLFPEDDDEPDNQ
mgnify:CR=1 FL=1